MLALTTGLGGAIGFSVMPLLCGVLLDRGGWRHAYLGLGLTILSIGLPILTLCLREGTLQDRGYSPEVQHGQSLSSAARSPIFWLLLSAVSLGASSLVCLFTHLIPMLQSRGISSAHSLALISVHAFSSTGWQVCLGLLLDRSRSPRFAAGSACAALCGVLLFATTRHTGLLMLSGVLLGMGAGTEYALLLYCIPRYFGLRSYGVIFGVIFALINLFTGLMPFLMDVLFDHGQLSSGAARRECRCVCPAECTTAAQAAPRGCSRGAPAGRRCSPGKRVG